MILNDLNQILQNSVKSVAQEMSVQIGSDLMKQINFEISSDFKTSVLILLTSNFFLILPFKIFPDGNFIFWEFIFLPFSITS